MSVLKLFHRLRTNITFRTATELKMQCISPGYSQTESRALRQLATTWFKHVLLRHRHTFLRVWVSNYFSAHFYRLPLCKPLMLLMLTVGNRRQETVFYKLCKDYKEVLHNFYLGIKDNILWLYCPFYFSKPGTTVNIPQIVHNQFKLS